MDLLFVIEFGDEEPMFFSDLACTDEVGVERRSTQPDGCFHIVKKPITLHIPVDRRLHFMQ